MIAQNSVSTTPAPAPDFDAPALTLDNMYLLVAIGGARVCPPLRAPKVPSK